MALDPYSSNWKADFASKEAAQGLVDTWWTASPMARGLILGDGQSIGLNERAGAAGNAALTISAAGGLMGANIALGGFPVWATSIFMSLTFVDSLGPGPEAGTYMMGNTNPFTGPVNQSVTVVDDAGNAIRVEAGQRITSSPNGEYMQVRDSTGRETGLRIDGGHKPSRHPDPRAQVRHGHVPGVSNPDKTPWLRIKTK